ncbi:MAG TPA: flagellar hook-basal body complex protein FliE [Bryobacteraceae bacterium]|nr:flagellar hook-basal body complex protein FliE [Bryobacteraceae bacterium]
MAVPIQPVSNAVPSAAASTIRPTATPAADAGVFQKILAGAVDQVESARADANLRIQSFLKGENEELHQVVIATQQAEISLELFQQVRNKVVQAYSEIMRMQM